MTIELSPGMKAPAFTLPTDGAGTASLAAYKGRQLVIYFYPKADTSGCTRESIAFSGLKTQFAGLNTDILGVSADPVKKQDKFKAKYDLTIPLASDETHAMLEAYGVWAEKSMWGRKYWGILRKTVLIDREGRIAAVWPKVSIDGHAEEVLAAAKALNRSERT